MLLCTNDKCCAPPPNDTIPITRDGPAEVGDIFLACAAMKHPFLEQIQSSGLTVRTYQSTVLDDVRSRCSQSPWSNGAKPCIISDAAEGQRPPRIYLIRVFKPDALPSVPELVRHYLIPIQTAHASPSSEFLYSGFHEHLHTTPSWAEGSHQWIMAIACDAEQGALGHRLRRRPTDGLPQSSHYYIDAVTMEKLEDISAAKASKWAMKTREDQERDIQQFGVRGCLLFLCRDEGLI